MENLRFITPQYTTATEIKEIRNRLGLTQKEFAKLIHCSKPSVERWERSREPISGPVVLLLQMLNRYPEYVQSIKVPDRVYPLRMWYMHNQSVCTLIDIDEKNRKIRIVNYTDNLMFRAFGKEETPDYDMYLEFIESRCFPKTRDKMKLILKDLDLPFYDPFLIIEKTQGKMAEDDFWIKIER
ncbi:MAG: helix-turn-helix domain-containing protein [Lachnospiraceae bacterium]|nr:helix-turn-helix domain-containing protein [Lachnospiraceae bacterium]